MTDGAAGGEPMGLLRQLEAARVADLLGVASMSTLGEPEGFLSPHSPAVERELVREIRAWTPALVYFPHPDEVHTDHAATSALASRACDKAGIRLWPELGERHRVEELRLYEVWTPLRRVDLLVDISAEADRKRAAMSQYESQDRLRRFGDAMSGLNAYRGLMTGVASSAEAFEVRSPRPHEWAAGAAHDVAVARPGSG
jgi:LmbE family N-acetylglucosaminyl deacetylase